MTKLWGLFSGLSLVFRLIIIALVVGAMVFAVSRFSGAIHYLIFGNTEAKVERGNVVVAKEQTKAEAKIADTAIEQVHERDVYREHVTNVVHDSEGKVDGAWHGETVGADVDAAGADALCRLHDTLCRGPRPAAVQPLR
jgi:hypothetical protein